MTLPTLSAILPLPGFVRQAGPKTYTPVSTWLIVFYVLSVSQSLLIQRCHILPNLIHLCQSVAEKKTKQEVMSPSDGSLKSVVPPRGGPSL